MLTGVHDLEGQHSQEVSQRPRDPVQQQALPRTQPPKIVAAEQVKFQAVPQGGRQPGMREGRHRKAPRPVHDMLCWIMAPASRKKFGQERKGDALEV